MTVLPFIDIPQTFDLGILDLPSFGLLVATGVLFGSYMARKYAERYKMDEDALQWLGVRLIVWGFIACHLVDVFFYTSGDDGPLLLTLDKLRKDNLILFKIWAGISSFGGIMGAAVAFAIYTRIRGLDRLRWADTFIYGFIPGFLFGRIGCSVAHDHMGVATDFFLAVDVPEGKPWPPGPRHDLGLYEAFVVLAIWGVVFALSRWEKRKAGTLIAAAALMYGPPRFFFDYLRRPDTDPRFFGLTFGQYAAIATTAYGAYMVFWRLPRMERSPLDAPDPGRDDKPSSSDGGGTKSATSTSGKGAGKKNQKGKKRRKRK